MSCYSDTQLAAALRLAGVGAGDAAFLVATAHPESGGCDVIQQGQPYGTTGWGIWQITPGNSVPQVATNNGLLGLMANARAAAVKLKSQGLGAWTTITSGAYAAYFDKAKQAVASVYNMPLSQVNDLTKNARSNGGTQTTGIHIPNPLNGLNDLGGSIIKGFLNAIDAPSLKDVAIRAGLIMFGAMIILLGLYMMTSKTVNETIVGTGKTVAGLGKAVR